MDKESPLIQAMQDSNHEYIVRLWTVAGGGGGHHIYIKNIHADLLSSFYNLEKNKSEQNKSE